MDISKLNELSKKLIILCCWIFSATVVRAYSEYWVDVRSDVIAPSGFVGKYFFALGTEFETMSSTEYMLIYWKIFYYDLTFKIHF